MYNVELEEALDIILRSIKKIEDTEEVRLENALGRILGEDFYAPMANPPFDRSPLDGFALRAKDTSRASKSNPITFTPIDKAYAGSPSTKSLGGFEAIRIMTGAKMPSGANCVIRLEDCIEVDNNIIIDKTLEAFENYCYKGEDIESGTLLLERGTKLSAIDLGVLGSMGQAKVRVIRRPKIGILVTGDEIVKHGLDLIDGKIYDTNGILLGSRIRELGFEYVKINTEKDDPKDVAYYIRENIENLDVLITTGGVSVGDKDIFHEVIEILDAKQLFWKVRMQPGTPAMYSILKDKPILSLSGNPFASLVTFELLARPLIGKISSDNSIATKKTKGIMMDDFNKKSKNRRFIRCIYGNGQVRLPEGGHSSGMLLSMTDCNALIDIEAGNTGLKKSDEVELLIL
ncbi:MAG: molybdopterin molybdotransferase MoeA [Tissierella sp.]|uniref:molybdopterin molybdotransferase MoeA n=1 Tax=Tissierella sp. TaxID=41274 RepID=UPI003F94E273